MKKIIYSALLTIVLLFSTASITSAASLGLTTQSPSLGSSSAFIDYLEFGVDGDILSFFNPIDSFSGVTPVGFSDLTFGVGFPLVTPTIGATGFFDVFDANGQFLSGDLFAVGFTQDVIELQFNNLTGSAAGSFGGSVLALVTFNDSLGLNPFNSFVDGDLYTASVSIANVVSEPAMMSLFLFAFLLMGVVRLRVLCVDSHNSCSIVHTPKE